MEQKPRRPVLTPPPAKAKPDLTSPSVPPSISQEAGYKRSNVLLFLVFAVVTVGAIGVVVILPRLVGRPIQYDSGQNGDTQTRNADFQIDENF